MNEVSRFKDKTDSCTVLPFFIAQLNKIVERKEIYGGIIKNMYYDVGDTFGRRYNPILYMSAVVAYIVHAFYVLFIHICYLYLYYKFNSYHLRLPINRQKDWQPYML